MITKKNNITEKNNEFILCCYKDIIESFFSKAYPDLDPEKFWCWFIKEFSRNELDINQPNPEDLDSFLSQLNKIADELFEPELLIVLSKTSK